LLGDRFCTVRSELCFFSFPVSLTVLMPTH
jgi:hypothetical protein